MHFVHQFQCFEVFLKCVFVIFKNFFFFLKILSKPLSASIDPICFSINRNCFKIFKEASICLDQSKHIFDQSKIVNQFFFKGRVCLVLIYFSKSFFKLFSLSELDKARPQFFVVFLWIFCKVFLSISR